MSDIEAIKANSDIVAVVGHYVQLKKRGAEFLGLCPFHADTTPSFYVIPAKNFCHCFACGASHDVIGFVQEIEGISFKQAVEKLNGGAEAVQWKPRKITQEAPPLPERVTGKPPKDAGEPKFTLHKLGEPSKVWTYRDGLGDVLGYVCRYETPEGKQIRAFTWGARGDRPAEWACGHWTKPRPLYGLDRLTDKPAASVLVVEGEKAADAAAELLPSYAVLTWPGGAQAWKHADLAPLRGRKVLLWPDNDEPGIKAMQSLAAILGSLEAMSRTLPAVPLRATLRFPSGVRLAASGHSIACRHNRRASWNTSLVLSSCHVSPHHLNHLPHSATYRQYLPCISAQCSAKASSDMETGSGSPSGSG